VVAGEAVRACRSSLLLATACQAGRRLEHLRDDIPTCGFQGFAWLSRNRHFYQVGDLSSRETQKGMFQMRKFIVTALMVAVPLTTAAACGAYDGYGYNASTYVAPRAYGYAPAYGYYGLGYYGQGYYGRTYGYYGYGARAVARGVVRRAAWRRWR
jgi:hypothetical protein